MRVIHCDMPNSQYRYCLTCSFLVEKKRLFTRNGVHSNIGLSEIYSSQAPRKENAHLLPVVI